jgi:hypothetical protein
MKRKVSRIDQLIAEQSTVSNAALKNALARQIENETKAQEERLLEQFNRAKQFLSNEVNRLRQLREQEKLQLKKVKSIDDAYEQFKKDGDYDTFSSKAVKY